ncbi:MAG: ABC transporter permease [Dermatophilaceae bacterium]
MTALALAAAELKRVTRDRTFLFFLVLLPILVILLVGVTTATSSSIRVGLVPGRSTPLATQLVNDLEADPALTTQRYSTRAEGVDALRRGEVEAVVMIPTTLDADLRSGRAVQVPVLVSGSLETSQAAVTGVSSVVARQGAAVQAAMFATTHSDHGFDENLATTRSLQRETPVVPVRTEVVNSKSDFLPLGYSYSAPTMLVLFVFINAMAGGGAMIQTRRFGIFARALAAPIRARDLVLGEALCYLALALLQALLIVVVGAVMFGVSWGNPLAAAALIGMWALVGTGAGMVSGTLFRTPEQAGAIGPAVGIAFGMLGGCMWPLEIVPESVRLAGHATPHAWAVDAWVTLLSRGGGLAEIAGYLAILAAYAVVLLGIASLRLHRSLVTP